MPIGPARELQARTSAQPPSWRRDSRRIQDKTSHLVDYHFRRLGTLQDRAEPHSAQDLAECGTDASQFGHSTASPNTNGLRTRTQSCRAKYADESLINLSSSAFGQHEWDSP